MEFQLVLLVLLVVVHYVLTFNLEPSLPVIKRGEISSYFGFSVAQHSTSNAIPWILVGAPLGQNLQPQTNRSGALFKCPVSGYEADCEQVVTDGKRDTEVNRLYRPSSSELKDGQWLGVNVKSQGAGGKVVVCAHRFQRQGPDFRWGYGSCIFLNESMGVYEALIPCDNQQRRGLEDYGYCQAGTSATLLADDTALMGAPGAFTARGMIYGISVSSDYLNRDLNRYHSPLLGDSPIDKYSYLGMSVTGGKFFDDKFSYVAGAPKAANFSGEVIFFEKGSDEVLLVRTILTGEGFAFSFGYELATLDLNGDKRPDLVVGAPFYVNKNLAGGAVYVYLNPKEGFQNSTPSVRLTGPTDSRFGYAISTIGDLNKDGFDDLAVGAPYAEQGRGCVYIYLGSKDGVIIKPSQVIKASSDFPHFPHLRTFGYSLSGGLDLDKNSYPDLLVGAYESDMIILLRSRPIIDIITEVSGNLTDIDPNGAGCSDDRDSPEVCFSLEACFEIRALVQVRSESLQVEYSIEAETFAEGKKFSRVRFKNGIPERPQVVKKVVTVKRDQVGKQCNKEVAYLNGGTTDIQSPIAFKLAYTLVQLKPTYIPNATRLPNIQNYPILNQQEASKVILARFEKDCGNNEFCESDLYVKASTDLPADDKDNYLLILGLQTEFVLNIDVQNFGESAYEATLYISHPKSMPYIVDAGSKVNFSRCSSASSKDLVICRLGNPYKNRSLETLKVRFHAGSLKDIETRLEFDVWANSTSFDNDEKNNRDRVIATVIKKAELSIYGKSDPENVYYGGKVIGESAIQSLAEIGPRIVHEYTIFNDGPWKASLFHVDIWWPHQVENKKPLGKWLLYPESMPPGDGDVTCIVPPNVTDVLHLRPKRHAAAVDEEDDEDEWVVAPQTEKGAEGKTKTFVELNCVRGSAKCFKIECVVRNLLEKESAVIKIHSRLWNSTLVEEYPSVDEVRISSSAHIRISEEIRQDPVNDVALALTTCYPDLKLKGDFKGIAWWIYLLSIIAGIIVLALIVFCLYRYGFFKRRRPEPTHTASVVKTKK